MSSDSSSLIRKGVLAAGLTALTLSLAAGAPGAALAAATPIPGGANQVAGVSGTLKSTLFNGKLRIRKMVLRTSLPTENKPNPGDTSLTLTYIVSNGTSKNEYGNFSANLADADGVIVNGHSVGVYGAYYTIGPGVPARGNIYFELPPGYTPVKILLTGGDGPAFRISVKPSDLPAAPAPAAAATP